MLELIVTMLLIQQPLTTPVKEEPRTDHIVAKGTAFPVALVNRLSTKNLQPGSNVYAKTVFPISVNNRIVIPEGASIVGKVLEVERAGRIKGRASLTISFQTLILPSGVTMPIYGSLGSADTGVRKSEATIEGESNRDKDVEDVAVNGTRGAIPGAVFGGLRGAGIGAGIGAGVGLAEVLIRRGDDLVLERGSTIEIVLDQELKF